VPDDRLREEAKPLRETGDLSSLINVIWVVQSLCEKNSAFLVGQIISTSSPRPASTIGAFRDRHERGAGCGGRGRAFDEWRVRRTAKSCGPDISTLMSSWWSSLPAMVARKPDHQGDHEGNR
jgi:hypothetical protein